MESDPALEDLHRTIILKVAGALFAVRLLALAAPFCDPALSTVAHDLEDALRAGRRAPTLRKQLGRAIARPSSLPQAEYER